MVDKTVIMNTIKNMAASGVDEETIRTTLKGIGLADNEIDQALAEAGVEGKTPAPTAVSTTEAIAEETAKKVREHIAEVGAKQELADVSTKAAIETHGAKLGEIGERVGEVAQKIGAIQTGTDEAVAVSKRLTEIEKQLADLKAQNEALQGLLQKILSTNREVLMNLPKK